MSDPNDPMSKYIAPLDPDVRRLLYENADLRARAERAEADLAVLVDVLRQTSEPDMIESWVDGSGVWFTPRLDLFFPTQEAADTLRRLLTEEQP